MSDIFQDSGHKQRKYASRLEDPIDLQFGERDTHRPQTPDKTIGRDSITSQTEGSKDIELNFDKALGDYQGLKQCMNA